MTIRTVHDLDGFDQVVTLQLEVWGPGDTCPRPYLKAVDASGGAIIGAFEGPRLVGFALGWTGWDGEGPFLYSHMLAVRPAHRREGLGRRLKEAERNFALERGLSRMEWTFDPFQWPNARLNLDVLGGRAVAFVPNCYGEMTDDLNRGGPSDRFVLRWDLTPPTALEAVRPGVGEEGILLEFPADLAALREQDPEGLGAWRQRFAFRASELFAQGYQAVGLAGDRPAYRFQRGNAR